MANYLYKNNSITKNHYITQGYVHSSAKHVDWDYTLKVFNNRNQIDRSLATLTTRYKAHMDKILNVTDATTGEKLSILNMDDNDVQALFEAAVAQMNNSIDKNFQSTIAQFESFEAAARAVSNVFSGEVDSKQFDTMMNSIESAIALVNSLNQESWNKFLLQYKAIMSDRKNMGKDKILNSLQNLNGTIETAPNDVMASVMRILANIPSNMIKDAENMDYSAKQMVGTLNSIFDTVIGEQLVAIMSDMILDVEEEINNEFVTMAKTTGRDTVTSMTNARKKVSGKVDVSKNSIMQLFFTSQKNEKKSYYIEGQFNSSVKWYTPKDTLPSHISVQSVSSYVRLANEIFNDDYSIYNTLAFSNSNLSKQQEGFRIIRSAIIAKYFDRFIAGSGQTTSSSGIDAASFLVINGKFYPIFSVLAAYLSDIKNKEKNYGSRKQGDLVYISLYDIDNDWQGDKKIRNYTQAMKRSAKAKAQINKFKANVSINTKNLQQICTRSGVKPIY